MSQTQQAREVRAFINDIKLELSELQNFYEKNHDIRDSVKKVLKDTFVKHKSHVNNSALAWNEDKKIYFFAVDCLDYFYEYSKEGKRYYGHSFKDFLTSIYAHEIGHAIDNTSPVSFGNSNSLESLVKKEGRKFLINEINGSLSQVTSPKKEEILIIISKAFIHSKLSKYLSTEYRATKQGVCIINHIYNNEKMKNCYKLFIEECNEETKAYLNYYFWDFYDKEINIDSTIKDSNLKDEIEKIFWDIIGNYPKYQFNPSY